MTQSGMKVCKHCNAQIAKSAKICPQCGGKNKGGIVWKIVIVFVSIIVVIAIFNPKDTKNKDKGLEKNNEVVEQKDNKKEENMESKAIGEASAKTEEKAMEYISYPVSKLMADLEKNALKAKDKYHNQNVELTGKLNVIDSSGKYISIVSDNDSFAIRGVTCFIKDKNQLDKIMEMSIDDIITVKGKIKDVGEVLGYSLDIVEIQ